jgi:hypothetical protein
MLDGATMHNVTSLDDGQIVTLANIPTCGNCDRGPAKDPPFPVDGKKCGGFRAVWYCNNVRSHVRFVVLFVSTLHLVI